MTAGLGSGIGGTPDNVAVEAAYAAIVRLYDEAYCLSPFYCNCSLLQSGIRVTFTVSYLRLNQSINQCSFIIWLSDRNHCKAQNLKVNIWEKCLKAVTLYTNLMKTVEISLKIKNTGNCCRKFGAHVTWLTPLQLRQMAMRILLLWCFYKTFIMYQVYSYYTDNLKMLFLL